MMDRKNNKGISWGIEKNIQNIKSLDMAVEIIFDKTLVFGFILWYLRFISKKQKFKHEFCTSAVNIPFSELND